MEIIRAVQKHALSFENRSDTFTVAANGAAVDLTRNPLKYFGIQVVGTGAAATAWDIRLEGSIDGTNYTQIIQHATADGDKAVKWQASASPVRHMRARCDSITLGGATNVVAHIVGVQ